MCEWLDVFGRCQSLSEVEDHGSMYFRMPDDHGRVDAYDSLGSTQSWASECVQSEQDRFFS